MSARLSTALECAESWHVSEGPTNNDPEEPRFAVHFMLDPGDGLCTTLMDGLRPDVAKVVAAAPRLIDALMHLRPRVASVIVNPHAPMEVVKMARADLAVMDEALRAAGVVLP